MSGNLSLLTVLFIMCYFIKKGENYAVTAITRAHVDYFTDVCQNCYKYGAKQERGICKCEPQSSNAGVGSVFLPDKGYCEDEKDLVNTERCQIWKTKYVEVMDTEGTNSYLFIKEAKYSSYQLEPLISYRNSTTGKWQFFNLSGNVLKLQNGPNPARLLQIQVTRVSSNLTQFKGYVMKLGLKRFHNHDGKNYKSCLIFKAKGEICFPLNCSIPTTPVSTTTTGIPSTTPGPVSTKTTCIPTTTTSSTPTTTVTPTTSSSTTTGHTTTKQPEIIVAIATGGTALVLMSLICAVLVYRYTYMCRPRGLQARNLGHDFDVIRNPGPQTYRTQEEPVYAEVSDIFPCGKGSAGPAKEWEESATVLLNPNLYEARFSRLPSRPEIEGNTNTQVDAGTVYPNDESKAIGEGAEDSIVLENPKVEETSSISLPRSKTDFTKLTEAHELDGQSIGDHQYHVEDDVDNSTVHRKSKGTSNDHYQVLEEGKRPHSVFICPSCSDNPVYQRPSMPHSCPHGVKDNLKENRASFYQSLRGLELGSRESVYMRPSQITEELAAEDKGNRNGEEGEGQAEYLTLEQEETDSNEDLAEPDNHDYNVLEGPGETGDEVDERAKDSISRDPDQTSEDSDLSLEPSKILNMEDNPAYAKPWKAKEDPELPLEPSDFLNIEHNPLYSAPWKTKTEELCLKRRAYSL